VKEVRVSPSVPPSTLHHRQKYFSLDEAFKFSNPRKKIRVDKISSANNYLNALFSVDLVLALV